MRFPVNPDDLDRPEQARMEVASGLVPEPALNQRRRFEDNVVMRYQPFGVELGERRDRRPVILIAVAE